MEKKIDILRDDTHESSIIGAAKRREGKGQEGKGREGSNCCALGKTPLQ